MTLKTDEPNRSYLHVGGYVCNRAGVAGDKLLALKHLIERRHHLFSNNLVSISRLEGLGEREGACVRKGDHNLNFTITKLIIWTST